MVACRGGRQKAAWRGAPEAVAPLRAAWRHRASAGSVCRASAGSACRASAGRGAAPATLI